MRRWRADAQDMQLDPHATGDRTRISGDVNEKVESLASRRGDAAAETRCTGAHYAGDLEGHCLHRPDRTDLS
jgi:hypothetical protein